MAKLDIFLVIFLFGQLQAFSIGKYAKVDIIVSIKGGVDGVHERLRAQTYATRDDRLNAVYNALTKHRDAAQQPFLDFLNTKKIWHNSLWISNQVFIPNVDTALLEEIQRFPGVSNVSPSEIIQIENPIIGEDEASIQAEWGVENILAPQAWAAGWTGAGAKVGVIDTGARHTHQAIASSYIGTVNYGWRDPYNYTQEPNDGNGRGTHCTGIVAGSMASGVGVAPGAYWMACKGCNDEGACKHGQILSCAQFMLCPTDASGNYPICSRAPDIISNTWSTGGTTGNWFDEVLQGWESAGIVGVFPIGDSGPRCSTTQYPGNSPLVIGVGASTNFDKITTFSSRGPIPGTSRIKPDVIAPGQNVRSSYYTSDTAYSTLTGTSMSCAHTAGTLALMFGKNPRLTFHFVKQILYYQTADKLPFGAHICGNVGYPLYPDNAYGWGKINAFRAVQAS